MPLFLMTRLLSNIPVKFPSSQGDRLSKRSCPNGHSLTHTPSLPFRAATFDGAPSAANLERSFLCKYNFVFCSSFCYKKLLQQDFQKV